VGELELDMVAFAGLLGITATDMRWVSIVRSITDAGTGRLVLGSQKKVYHEPTEPELD
jgi:hypothetical protein